MNCFKKISLLVIVGGVVALGLRLLQNLTGFESDTGLAVSGHPIGVVLPAVLVAVTAVLVFLSRKLPGKAEAREFDQVFAAKSAAQLTVIVMGIFMMAVSGALQLMFAVMGGGLQSVMHNSGMLGVVWMGPASSKEIMILGVLALVSAVCLFPAAAAYRRRDDREAGSVNGGLLLVPVVCMVVRLVMLYRINSVDPVLQAYYLELLALVCITMALYRLAGFTFGQGRIRGFTVYSGLTVVLCAATLADGHDVSGLLFYAGSALTVLGFWLLYHENAPLPEE